MRDLADVEEIRDAEASLADNGSDINKTESDSE